MGIYTERNYSLEDAKNACAPEIESWYGNKVLDVFDSSALGPTYRYYCSEADQLRMINGRVSNTSISLICGLVPTQPDVDPVYDWLEHSSTEAGKVHTDYVQFSKATSTLYASLKQQLANATTVEQVETIFYQLV
jgi:hypothetical protein